MESLAFFLTFSADTSLSDLRARLLSFFDLNTTNKICRNFRNFYVIY